MDRRGNVEEGESAVVVFLRATQRESKSQLAGDERCGDYSVADECIAENLTQGGWINSSQVKSTVD